MEPKGKSPELSCCSSLALPLKGAFLESCFPHSYCFLLLSSLKCLLQGAQSIEFSSKYLVSPSTEDTELDRIIKINSKGRIKAQPSTTTNYSHLSHIWRNRRVSPHTVWGHHQDINHGKSPSVHGIFSLWISILSFLYIMLHLPELAEEPNIPNEESLLMYQAPLHARHNSRWYFLRTCLFPEAPERHMEEAVLQIPEKHSVLKYSDQGDYLLCSPVELEEQIKESANEI